MSSDETIQTSSDDAEGHRISRAETEQAEGDDAGGHASRFGADAERSESDDDAEGHAKQWPLDTQRAEGDDDTKGHMFGGETAKHPDGDEPNAGYRSV